MVDVRDLGRSTMSGRLTDGQESQLGNATLRGRWGFVTARDRAGPRAPADRGGVRIALFPGQEEDIMDHEDDTDPAEGPATD